MHELLEKKFILVTWLVKCLVCQSIDKLVGTFFIDCLIGAGNRPNKYVIIWFSVAYLYWWYSFGVIS